MKHKDIALRFLPQKAYEAAAPPEIKPTPDVITRLFMLFRGLTNEEASHDQWRCAATNKRAAEHWKDVVGYI